MMKLRMLVLTDHHSHSAENSIYALLRALRLHPACAGIDVASRANPFNRPFFERWRSRRLFASPVDASFGYYPDGRRFQRLLRAVSIDDYDLVLLRLPPPLPEGFLHFLTDHFPESQIINRPSGIRETSSKKFLLQFPDLCPDMQLCRTVDEVLAFAGRFPAVFKPLQNYGGRGIVRIEKDQVWEGNTVKPLSAFLNTLSEGPCELLGMRFLRNLSQGDKRVVVCNRTLLGASLRMPAHGSWVCNAAQGGTPYRADITAEERQIARRLTPALFERGIVLFGFDTLVDDNGRRVLSEINTASIGGLVQMARLNGEPMVARIAGLIWDYAQTVVVEPKMRNHPSAVKG